MEDILKDISAVAGVRGCFVCDGDGRVMASTLSDTFDESTLAAAGRTINQTTAGLLTTRRRKVQELDLLYSKQRLVIKPLGEGCLCVLCARNVNVPLLNLTANVAARKLTEAVRTEAPQPSAAHSEATPVHQVSEDIVDAYPDIVGPILDFEHDLSAGARDSVLTEVGQRVAKTVFQRRYASVSVSASVPQALSLVVVPAVSPFAIANAQGNRLDVLVCPFCRNLPSPVARCHFLAGFVQGLLNSIPGIDDVEVSETLCRAKGDDTCSFMATRTGGQV
jgi:predicted hydrocarbon binding protein/predicted regulator of Ras-like GTPase activity (Roadblock/LC7/MglB family)